MGQQQPTSQEQTAKFNPNDQVVDINNEKYEYKHSQDSDFFPYGYCKVFAHCKSGKQIAILQKSIESKELLQQIVGKYLEYQNIVKEKQYFVQLYKFHIQEGWGLTGTNYALYAAFQYRFPISLTREFAIRRIVRINYYSQIFNFNRNLWLILHQSLSALYQMKKIKISHKNITPKNIFITDGGEIALLSPQLKIKHQNLTQINWEQTIYDTRLKLSIKELKKDCYLSPQLFHRFKFNDLNPSIQVHKDDVFALGLIMLECSILQRINKKFYNFKDYTLNWKYLNEMITMVRNSRSRQYSSIICKMLIEEEFARPDIEVLLFEIDVLKSKQQIEIPDSLIRMIGNVRNYRQTKKLAHQFTQALLKNQQQDNESKLTSTKKISNLFTNLIQQKTDNTSQEQLQEIKENNNYNNILLPPKSIIEKNSNDMKFKVQGQLDMLDEKIRRALLKSQQQIQEVAQQKQQQIFPQPQIIQISNNLDLKNQQKNINQFNIQQKEKKTNREIDLFSLKLLENYQKQFK